MHARRLVGLALVGAVAGHAGPARAAGPLAVNGAGQPLVWTSPVPFSPDRGALGALDNAAAVATVTADFAVWAAVPTAAISFTNAGQLPVDVTVANATTILGACDGTSPIVFDADGSIIDLVLGSGASSHVLGFAGPACGRFVPPTITEGDAVLNGKFIDGIDDPSNPEISVTEFNAVFIHEFGHYLNLDHSQLNLAEAFDGNAANDEAVPTMFPILVNGATGGTLHLDDRVSLSILYPAGGGAAGLGRLTGRVFESDGATPFQGANVIARRQDDPLLTAASMVSGARFAPSRPGGPPDPELEGLFELPGLPPGSYTVEIEAISDRFQGGSSVGPVDPPRRLPGPPEFWNGADEGSEQPPDDPTVATPIGVPAGGTVSGIDIVLNRPVAPPNDECVTATTVDALPFSARIDTSLATSAPTDPMQTCTGQQNSASVWYRFTAPAAAMLMVGTTGSGYDTVLAAYTGTCSALSETACDDDGGGRLASRMQVEVGAGQTVLFEVSAFGSVSGGDLRFEILEIPAYERVAPDPIGDTFGTGPGQPDATALSACREGGEARIELTFAGPISPADSGRPDALAGYIDLDVDQASASGVESSVDRLAGLPAGLGVDYVVDLFSATATAVLVHNGRGSTTVPVQFTPTSLLVRVPLNVLSDDGLLNAASLIGTRDVPTDAVPNGGHVRSAATCATTTTTTTTLPPPACRPGTDCDGDVCTVGDVCASGTCLAGPRLDSAGLSAWFREAVIVPECAGIKRAGRVIGKLKAAGKAVGEMQGASRRSQRKKLVAAAKRIDAAERITGRIAKKLGPICQDGLLGRLSGARSRIGCLR